jgi:hypothetical protein
VWEAISELRRGQTDELQCIARLRIDILLATQSRHQRHVPQHAPVWNEAAVLLHVANPATQLDHILVANVAVADDYLATERLDKAVEAPQQRCLSRSALAYQRGCGADRHFDAYIAEGDDIAKSM